MLVIAATALASAAAGATAMVVHGRRLDEARRTRTREQTQPDPAQALADAATMETSACEDAAARQARLTEDDAELHEALDADEQRLVRTEAAVTIEAEQLQTNDETLGARFDAIKTRRVQLRAHQAEIKDVDRASDEAMEDAAGQTREAIIEELAEAMGRDVHLAVQKAARLREEVVADRCEFEARRIMDLALQRHGAPVKVNRLVAKVEMPKSSKLRLALETDADDALAAIHEACDVAFEPIDDGFYLQAPDPFTREIGRIAYDRMVKAGLMNATIAQKAVAKAEQDLHKIAQDAGNRAARLLRLKNIAPEVLFLVGKLLYRTSYTQNQWQHALEAAHLAGMMASDLGMNPRDARRAGLLHDIGKVLWAETEAIGSHAVSGANFAELHGEAPEIVHPIRAHHADEKPATSLAHLIAAADALSGGRPGARRETLELYTQRIEALESICTAFPQITKSFVIQGGRELRILVDPRRLDDLGANKLALDVAQQVEENCTYPGKIKVMVIREVRALAMAR